MAGTVRLDPELEEHLKRRAKAAGKSVTRLVNDTLWFSLNRQRPGAPADPPAKVDPKVLAEVKARPSRAPAVPPPLTTDCPTGHAKTTNHGWGTTCDDCGKKIR